MPLDEIALRRPEWVEGVPLLLGDGQEWHVPAPVVADDLVLSLGPDGKPQLRCGFAFGAEYNALTDRYIEATSGVEEILALVEIAYFLIRLNYNLTFEAAAPLLRVVRPGGKGEAENQEMWRRVAEVALGRDPKGEPTPTGS